MKIILSLAFMAGLALATATPAAAMMAPPAPHAQSGSLIQVRDGCGRGFHEGRHGRCVRNDDGWDGGRWFGGEWRDRGWHDDGDRHGDGCGRHHHRNRWGRCVSDW